MSRHCCSRKQVKGIMKESKETETCTIKKNGLDRKESKDFLKMNRKFGIDLW